MLLSYLKGEEKLWKAFWIFGVLIPILLDLLTGLVGVFFKSPYFLSLMLTITTVSLAYGILATWQCASNCNKRLWMWLARMTVILFIIFILFYAWNMSINKYILLANSFFNACFIIFVSIWLFKRNTDGFIYKFLIPVSLLLGLTCFVLLTLFIIIPTLTK